jgi:hypothetical protein
LLRNVPSQVPRTDAKVGEAARRAVASGDGREQNSVPPWLLREPPPLMVTEVAGKMPPVAAALVLHAPWRHLTLRGAP